jgi:hypothetical protein
MGGGRPAWQTSKEPREAVTSLFRSLGHKDRILRREEGGSVPGFVEGIYVASGAGAPVERVGEIAAIEGCGLASDRYCEGTGHWSRFGRVWQVTLIAAEDLDAIEKETASASATASTGATSSSVA